jgi:hypothetical protein
VWKSTASPRRRLDACEVLDADDVDTRGVDKPAARDDLRDGLDAQARHAVGAGQFGDAPAAVTAVAHLEVTQGIDVRPELLRGRDLLGDPVDAVLPDAHAVGVVGRGDERLAEEAAGEGRDGLVEHASEVVQPALADEAERLQALGLVHVGEHADLVAHSDDHGVEKLGNRVRPPSTKIVWPVM